MPDVVQSSLHDFSILAELAFLLGCLRKSQVFSLGLQRLLRSLLYESLS